MARNSTNFHVAECEGRPPRLVLCATAWSSVRRVEKCRTSRRLSGHASTTNVRATTGDTMIDGRMTGAAAGSSTPHLAGATAGEAAGTVVGGRQRTTTGATIANATTTTNGADHRRRRLKSPIRRPAAITSGARAIGGMVATMAMVTSQTATAVGRRVVRPTGAMGSATPTAMATVTTGGIAPVRPRQAPSANPAYRLSAMVEATAVGRLLYIRPTCATSTRLPTRRRALGTCRPAHPTRRAAMARPLHPAEGCKTG